MILCLNCVQNFLEFQLVAVRLKREERCEIFYLVFVLCAKCKQVINSIKSWREKCFTIFINILGKIIKFNQTD